VRVAEAVIAGGRFRRHHSAYEACLGRSDPGSGVHPGPVLQPGPQRAAEDAGWLAGVASLAGLTGGILLWWRRRAPIEVVGGATACYVLQASIAGPVVPAAVLVASYSVARYATPVGGRSQDCWLWPHRSVGTVGGRLAVRGLRRGHPASWVSAVHTPRRLSHAGRPFQGQTIRKPRGASVVRRLRLQPAAGQIPLLPGRWATRGRQ
jgi:hypothetical protein